jgi:hypothetical protein
MAAAPKTNFVSRFLASLDKAFGPLVLGKASNYYMERYANGGTPNPDAPTPPAAKAKTVYEPVFGWTPAQLDDYLTRNPGFRPTYEARLQTYNKA